MSDVSVSSVTDRSIAGGEEKSSPWSSGDDGGVDAKGSSDSESGISTTDLAGALRRLGVAGAAAGFAGDLTRFGDAAFAFARLATGATASFLGRPRAGFSMLGVSVPPSTDFFLPRLGGTGGSAALEIDAIESFLGLPRGRFLGDASLSLLLAEIDFLLPRVLATSDAEGAGVFLGLPLGREGDAACSVEAVEMVAWPILLPKLLLF